jgi:hypothetical protein
MFTRTLLLTAFTVSTFCSSVIAQTETGSPTESPEPALPIPSSSVDLFSLKVNIRQLYDLRQSLQQTYQEDAIDSDLLDVAGVFGDPRLFERDGPIYMRQDVMLSFPQMLPIITVLYPNVTELAKEISGEDSQTLKTDGSIQHIEGNALIATEDYIAMLYGEGIDTSGITDRLTTMVSETENSPITDMLSVSTQPRAIGRSPYRQIINGLKATMLTNAQRRDNERDFEHAWRSLFQRSAAAMLDTLFDDIDTVELSLNRSREDGSLTIELRIDAHEDSALDQYIAGVRESGNRALSWLYPDHTTFAAVSLRLPELVKDSLPQIAAVSAAILQEELKLSENSTREIELLLNQYKQRGTAELLVQAIPAADGTTALVGVLPVDGDVSFSPTLLELVSAVGESGIKIAVTDIDGWPVHRIPLATNTPDVTGDFYFVATESALAWMVGTEEAISVFEKVVQRQYTADQAGNRFRRSILAIQSSISSLLFPPLDGGVREYLPQRAEQDTTPLQDQFEIVIDTEPHQILLSGRFQRDAVLLGLNLFETGFVGLAESSVEVIE